MNTNATISPRVRWLPKTVGGRVLLGLSSAILALLIVAGIVASSVWVEDRFPSDEANRALLPGVQRVTTKPIVNVLSRQIEHYIRSRAEMMYMSTGLTVDEAIAQFLDERLDLSARRNFAYRLARIGTPECIAALLKVFQTAPAEHKAFMAQLIGSTGNPAAKPCLLPLLSDSHEPVVVAAIHGLSAIGGADVTTLMAGILGDAQRSDQIRVAAARGLGVIGTPTAREVLVETLGRLPASDLATQILESLGRFEFPTVAKTFEEYLAAPATPQALRVAAVEALAHSSAEAVPLLLKLASGDADADVRASAAWAISTHDAVTDLGPALATMAERESAADVRRRLYEALLPQAGIPAERLLPIIQAEGDIGARVAGFNALGRAVRQASTTSVATEFDQKIVPELAAIATTENSLNIQMRAVFALRRAGTPAAQAALATIAIRARPQVATAARNGLRTTNS